MAQKPKWVILAEREARKVARQLEADETREKAAEKARDIKESRDLARRIISGLQATVELAVANEETKVTIMHLNSVEGIPASTRKRAARLVTSHCRSIGLKTEVTTNHIFDGSDYETLDVVLAR